MQIAGDWLITATPIPANPTTPISLFDGDFISTTLVFKLAGRAEVPTDNKLFAAVEKFCNNKI
jgi:hypothetical protein